MNEPWEIDRLVPVWTQLVMHAEFDALSEHCKFAKSMLEQEHWRLDHEIEKMRNGMTQHELDASPLFDDAVDLQQKLPALQWMSTFLLVYGVFEKNLNSICAATKKPEGIRIGLRHVTGQGIERARTYLTKVCNLTEPFDSPEWAEIMRLSRLRNLVAHASGEINKSEPKQKEVLDWCRQQPTIRVVGEETDWHYVEIALTADFVFAAADTFHRFLGNLCRSKRAPSAS